MKKKTKLPEKPSRMPDLWSSVRPQKVRDYLREIPEHSESARSHLFVILLKDLFGEVHPKFVETYLKGVEKYIRTRQKDFVLKGRPDALFGNLVIEFERDLRRTLSDAQEQLKKYMAILWSEAEERKVSWLCLATDGVSFRVYSPRLPADEKPIKPEQIKLEEVDKVDFRSLKNPDDAYFWLDRYLFRKEIRAPKTEEFVKDFGLDSPAFKNIADALTLGWERVKFESDFKVIYQNWEKYLRITYGSAVADEPLFIKHTYLATLAKLLAWIRISGTERVPGDDEVTGVLQGTFFKKKGIENFLEEDLFSWVAREHVRELASEVCRKLLSLLSKYNLKEISEDVLKSLYQELVDPETRHDLGEYYTPDWLAQRMVEHALKNDPGLSVLDPACGSGTFLNMVIRHKRERMDKTLKTLKHIKESVVGIDIHPLAVIIAKTTYLLALGDLLAQSRGRLYIPVYLADAIRLPQPELKVYPISLEGKEVWIPEALLKDPSSYDEAIELCTDFAKTFSGKAGATEEAFFNFAKQRSERIASDSTLAKALYRLSRTLKELIEQNKDTIYGFVLKNFFKPIILKEQFDLVVGNPPWLSYRYVEKGEYQNWLKARITEEYRLLTEKPELMTHMELATLFFVRTADLYLKKGGTIGFVMPRSIFTADQHDRFRRSLFHLTLGFEQAWDLEGVEPLFNVPACVLFGRKGEFSEPILACHVISAHLPKKNSTLLEAEEFLNLSSVSLSVHKRGKRSFFSSEVREAAKPASFYQRYFKEGATIVPRSLWFVEIKADAKLGLDPSRPFVVTAERAMKEAKTAYKGLEMEGNIEAKFLYATLLSTDIVPFGHLDFRAVVLPIEPSGKNYKVLTAGYARNSGFHGLAQWLDKAQGHWKVRRGEKAGKMDIYQRLDHIRGITGQNRRAKYKVLYPMSATYICGCVVENKPVRERVGEQSLSLKGFLADYKTFYYDTDEKAAAYYLAAVLNSAIVDRAIKPMQSRGLWGPRDICKKVWELPIPRYDPANRAHEELARLGHEYSKKVAGLIAEGFKSKSIGHIRKIIKVAIKDELVEMDKIVARLLGKI